MKKTGIRTPIAFSIFVISFALYYWTRTLDLNSDSPFYLGGIETVYFHSYHLLHTSFYKLFYFCYRLFVPNPEFGVFSASLVFNSILGASALAIFFLLLHLQKTSGQTRWSEGFSKKSCCWSLFYRRPRSLRRQIQKIVPFFRFPKSNFYTTIKGSAVLAVYKLNN